jgi:hypothetical protein
LTGLVAGGKIELPGGNSDVAANPSGKGTFLVRPASQIVELL